MDKPWLCTHAVVQGEMCDENKRKGVSKGRESDG